MNLIVLKSETCLSIHDFIDYWKRYYDYKDDGKYHNNINAVRFEKKHLDDLFNWKNGMTLVGSIKKEKAYNDKILAKIDTINTYKQSETVNIEAFNSDFKEVSAVWKIFLLHIIKPKAYPIYDQHIHRAYNYIHGKEWDKVTNTMPDKLKLELYFGPYLTFVQESGVEDLKALDEALFAFGQFLNTRKQGRMVNRTALAGA